MTDERMARVKDIISKDTNEQLMSRLLWYCNNWNPVDFDRCDDFELVKAECLRRMER